MDGDRFDDVARSLIRGTSRRTALSFALATLVTTLGSTEGDARRRRNRRKRRQQQQPPPPPPQPCGAGVCGVCQSCQQSTCVPVADGTDCGNCQTCQGGQCASCPQNQVCCENVGTCKDVRNDSAFCGQCNNGRCPSGAICANGRCGQLCNTSGAACPVGGCHCAVRNDFNHPGNVCVIDPLDCDTATECITDADCAPATLGFRKVCVGGPCPGKIVCADPCA